MQSSRSSSSSESPPKGLSGVKKTVCRPLPPSFPPGISPLSKIDWMLKEQSLWKIYFSNRMESESTPSTEGRLIFHQSVLELLESKPRIFWNPRSTRLLSCCFLHREVEANASLRNLVLHVLRTLSAIPALSCPNEVLRQMHNYCNHFGDRYWQSSSTRRIGSNNFPLPLGRRNGSFVWKRTIGCEKCWGCPHKSPWCLSDLKQGPRVFDGPKQDDPPSAYWIWVRHWEFELDPRTDSFSWKS